MVVHGRVRYSTSAAFPFMKQPPLTQEMGAELLMLIFINSCFPKKRCTSQFVVDGLRFSSIISSVMRFPAKFDIE
jgi:hypothetical protein